MFAERRERVRAEMGEGAVAIFVGTGMVPRSNDTEFPFRQDSDFWYLTGFDHPNAVAVLRPPVIRSTLLGFDCAI